MKVARLQCSLKQFKLLRILKCRTTLNKILSTEPSYHILSVQSTFMKRRYSEVAENGPIIRNIVSKAQAFSSQSNVGTSYLLEQTTKAPFLLFYDYMEGIGEKRAPFRDGHLKLAKEWEKSGNLLLGGAFSNPLDGAVIVFLAENESEIEENFVKKDPYFLNGLVRNHKIRPWTVVVGTTLATVAPSAEIGATNEEVPPVQPQFPHISGMTGFSRTEGTFGRHNFSWEARSLNGRSLDVRCRIPDAHVTLQQAATSAVGEIFTRGSVSLFLSVQVDKNQKREGQLRLNTEELNKLSCQLLEAQKGSETLMALNPPSFDALLRLPGMLEWKDDEDNEEAQKQLQAIMTSKLLEVLEALRASREAEGDRICQILAVQLEDLGDLVEECEGLTKERTKRVRDKFLDQVKSLLSDESRIDPLRVEQEIAILASKLDIQEELDRLRIHVESAQKLLRGESLSQKGTPKKAKKQISVEEQKIEGKAEEGSGDPQKRTIPIGRSLEFLTQELSREANTLCSKANDISLTQVGLKMKGIIEQIREQAANIE